MTEIRTSIFSMTYITVFNHRHRSGLKWQDRMFDSLTPLMLKQIKVYLKVSHGHVKTIKAFQFS